MTIALLASLAVASEPALETTAKVLEGLELSHRLELVETGSEPLRQVKLAPTTGSTSRYQLITAQDLEMAMSGPDGTMVPMPAMPGMSPTIVFDVDQSVLAPVAQGLVPVQVTYTDVAVQNVPPEMEAQMAPGLAPMKGLGFRLLVDPEQGRAVQADVSTDDPMLFEITQGMADQFINSLPQFPDTPIGVGAQWTVDIDMNVGGIPLVSHQTVTVTELSDDHITTKVVYDMKRGEGGIQLPGLPPGAEVDIAAFDGDGQGELRTDLHSLVSTGSMATVVDLTMTVGGAGQPPMTMGMKTSQTITMKARP